MLRIYDVTSYFIISQIDSSSWGLEYTVFLKTRFFKEKNIYISVRTSDMYNEYRTPYVIYRYTGPYLRSRLLDFNRFPHNNSF